MQNAERCKKPPLPAGEGVGGEADQHAFCYAPTELYQTLETTQLFMLRPYRAEKQMAWLALRNKATAWRLVNSIAGTKVNKLRRSVTRNNKRCPKSCSEETNTQLQSHKKFEADRMVGYGFLHFAACNPRKIDGWAVLTQPLLISLQGVLQQAGNGH
jgi:hypothetical protein